jgi:hypothetical protein
VCHIINLVVQDSITVVTKYLDNVSAVVRFITSTPQMIKKFGEYCKANNLKSRKFGLDMKIRWNSTYLMLKKLEGYKKIITVFVNVNALDIDLVLTEADWYMVKHFRELLMPFYVATNVLSGVYYPTSCLVIDYIWLIAESFAKHRSDSLLCTVVAPMELKFLKYFDNISHIYCFATILDPRKKLDGFQSTLEGIGDLLDMDYSYAFNHVKDELFRVFCFYYNKYGESDVTGTMDETDIEQSDSSLIAHLWKRLKGKEFANSTVNQRWNPNAELNYYLSTNFAAIDRTLKGDKVKLLEWWREHKYSFQYYLILLEIFFLFLFRLFLLMPHSTYWVELLKKGDPLLDLRQWRPSHALRIGKEQKIESSINLKILRLNKLLLISAMISVTSFI